MAIAICGSEDPKREGAGPGYGLRRGMSGPIAGRNFHLGKRMQDGL